MIDIFDALDIPASFLYFRADRLEQQAGEFGIRIKARWRDRVFLVTSDISLLRAPLPTPVVEDLIALTLDLGPPGKTFRYLPALKQFFAHAMAAERALPRPYERVPGSFGRVHLVRPFEATAACGAKGFVERAISSPITCRACVELVLKFQGQAVNPLVAVALLADEMALARKALGANPTAPEVGDPGTVPKPGTAEDLTAPA